ncbi:MAG: dienelactone hydrolase family protein [Alphaproteobacteria bacterium]
MFARRTVLKGLAGAPLAAVLADPHLARAAAESLEPVGLKTAGGKEVFAALAVPDQTPAPAVLLVHEWWGLNDQIKSVAREFAGEGFLALAADLYDGEVADDPDRARALTKRVVAAEAFDTLGSWIDWVKETSPGTGKVGTVGWCFGGGWSLNASLVRPIDATVVYYGNVRKTAAELAPLKGPVLGHFATRDRWINAEMVSGFAAAMDAAGKTYEVHWYEADHAFANPTQARYDAADAALAWRRTLAFLRAHLF